MKRTVRGGVRPLSGLGMLFLLGFVSFLTLTFVAPHVHGADSAPPSATAAAFTDVTVGAHVASSQVVEAPANPAHGEDTTGIAAICVLVLLVTLVFLAARHGPERAPVRRSETPLLGTHPDGEARGLTPPLFRLLSISRT